MKILLQISFLFILTLLGEVISEMLPFAFPGTLIGMFLLLLLFMTGAVKEEQLAESAGFFQSYMAMFFVPAGVELVENLELLTAGEAEQLAVRMEAIRDRALQKIAETFARRSAHKQERSASAPARRQPCRKGNLER